MKNIPIILGILVPICFTFFVHSIIKLPSEPLWTTPLIIYENYAFAMALGLGVPLPMMTSGIFLVLLGFITFWIWNRIIRFFQPAAAEVPSAPSANKEEEE